MACTTTARVGSLALVLLAALPGLAAEPEPAAGDVQLLKEHGIATNDAGLLEFFRQRTLTDANRERVERLVRQLADRSFRVREKASAAVIELGPLALPALRQAIGSSDPEAARRAERCLHEIERGPGAALVSAAARLVAVRRPAGAVEVLLTYLPSAPDEGAALEVQAALAAAARHDGTADPVLVKALGDQHAARRAAAAEALCEAGAAGKLPAVRKLLRDPEAMVRLRTAVALVYARERDAVPVLIDLLAELPRGEMWRAEQVLHQLADDGAPAGFAGGNDSARRQYRDAWAAWWREHGARVDLTALRRAPRFLGYTLIVLLDAGKVIELGSDRKPRFEIGGLQAPLDAQVLPGDRVLIAEHGRGVTERNRKGDVLWQKNVARPIVAQRLPNGNTFIATRAQLLEVDRSGKELFAITRADNTFVTARKLPDGRVGCVSGGNFVLFNTSGKELKSFPVGNVQTTSSLDVLPNGHVLVAQYGGQKVVEFDADGKPVWEANVSSPISVVRLPNGHTLVASYQGQKQVVELDQVGKTVWDYQIAGHATRARQR
jgi:hypothetical protein